MDENAEEACLAAKECAKCDGTCFVKKMFHKSIKLNCQRIMMDSDNKLVLENNSALSAQKPKATWIIAVIVVLIQKLQLQREIQKILWMDWKMGEFEPFQMSSPEASFSKVIIPSRNKCLIACFKSITKCKIDG